ncbi:MAG: hypothetical protein JSS49_27250 [Planctomycetes bacterium]|nr:hypothetical protein [Planctomycetota bacterium]
MAQLRRIRISLPAGHRRWRPRVPLGHIESVSSFALRLSGLRSRQSDTKEKLVAPTQPDIPSSEEVMRQKVVLETASDGESERGRVRAEVAGEIASKDVETAKSVSPGSLLVKFGRFILFVVLVLFSSIMCLGVGVAILECIGSYYDEDHRLGEFLFTALFEGFLGWGALWLALRLSPWAKPGRKTWRWVRIVLATGVVILIAMSLIVVLVASIWLLGPLRHGNTEVPPASDISGTWNLDLKESSPDFGPAAIESGTLEFLAGGLAKRTLRLKQFGEVTEYVSYLDDWKLVRSDKLRFKLRKNQERYELSISLTGDQLSFTDWETFGVETWHRILTMPQE